MFTYRGYVVLLNPDGIWDIHYQRERVDSAESASDAKRVIDSWLDAR